MLTKTELKTWTTYLLEHPDRQHTGSLANDDYTKFCCLGALCEVQELEHGTWSGYAFPGGEPDGSMRTDTGVLAGDLAKKLGCDYGVFFVMGMPDLVHEGCRHRSLTNANDRGVPWSVIADHLDAFYPAVEG